ncbi:DNA primase [Pseudomonas phage vB_PpuP-Luutsna-6]
MLRPESWLPQAQALGLGHKHRCGHDCGPGQVLIVEHKAEGWSAYCFRCDDRGWKSKPLPTLGERLALRDAVREAEQVIENDPRPPQPCEFDIAQWPLQARVWLYKAALTNEDIQHLGIYYHPPTKRVVLPVLDNGELIYWQARRIFGDAGPKYLNPVVSRGSVVPRFGSGPAIVLTEDILSAVRCGMAAEAWSLMGVKLCDPVLARLMADTRPVLVWLDPDKAGWNGAAAIERTLSLAGVPHAVINSAKDPKLLSRAEVARHIQEALSSVTRHHTAASNEAQEGVPSTAPHGE